MTHEVDGLIISSISESREYVQLGNVQTETEMIPPCTGSIRR